MPKIPSHHREPWSAQDKRALKQLAGQNTPTRVIALKLGRTPAAIYREASNLDIPLSPYNQSPYNRRKQ